MFTMCTLPLTHVEILRLRDAIELNNDGRGGSSKLIERGSYRVKGARRKFPMGSRGKAPVGSLGDLKPKLFC